MAKQLDLDLFNDFLTGDLQPQVSMWLLSKVKEAENNFHRDRVDPECLTKIALKKAEMEGIARFIETVVSEWKTLRKSRLSS